MPVVFFYLSLQCFYFHFFQRQTKNLAEAMALNKREEALMAATRYRVIQSSTNTMGDGINLQEGEELQVREKTDGGWWLVKGVHGEGWAPSAYIGIIPPSKPEVCPEVLISVQFM